MIAEKETIPQIGIIYNPRFFIDRPLPHVPVFL